jgi:SAM-dependent methyltransferase
MIETNLLRCPACRSQLKESGDQLSCQSFLCRKSYPRTEAGSPVLLNEKKSLFSIETAAAQRTPPKAGLLKRFLRLFIPSIGHNPRAGERFRKLSELLLAASPKPRVLVIGGEAEGKGFSALSRKIERVETDVLQGERTELICDAHDLPFQDASFDGVIIQAVLEHVLDPQRCVDELHRVLKPGGLVYAETPFMQQVHMGRHDFTRFTHLGHRRLFRRFTEIESGAACGPGTALAWAYTYFLLSFTESRQNAKWVRLFAHFTSFFWKYFDLVLEKKGPALDAASGLYFLGRSSETELSDKELIALYRGLG